MNSSTHKTSRLPALFLAGFFGFLAACAENAPEVISNKTTYDKKTGTVKNDLTIGKDLKPKFTLDITIPAGAKEGKLKIEDREILIPGNDSVNAYPVKITVYDPLVVQIPADWHLETGTYRTKSGSGRLSIDSNPIPSMVSIDKSGRSVTTRYFKPERGKKLFLLDMPDAHKAGGRIEISWRISAPRRAHRIDVVKFIPTWTVRDRLGALLYHAALDAPDDFAKLSNPMLIWDYDMTGPSCVGPRGNSPDFELTGGSWRLGSTGSVRAIDLDPKLPAALALGVRSRLHLPLGGMGCKLRVLPLAIAALRPDAKGRAALAFQIPPSPALVGTALEFQTWQAVGGTMGILGTVLTTQIRR